MNLFDFNLAAGKIANYGVFSTSQVMFRADLCTRTCIVSDEYEVKLKVLNEVFTEGEIRSLKTRCSAQ